jgi:hypothetical protein
MSQQPVVRNDVKHSLMEQLCPASILDMCCCSCSDKACFLDAGCDHPDPRCVCFSVLWRSLFFLLHLAVSIVVVPPLFLLAGLVRASVDAFWLTYGILYDAFARASVGWNLRFYAVLLAVITLPLSFIGYLIMAVFVGVYVAFAWPLSITCGGSLSWMMVFSSSPDKKAVSCGRRECLPWILYDFATMTIENK